MVVVVDGAPDVVGVVGGESRPRRAVVVVVDWPDRGAVVVDDGLAVVVVDPPRGGSCWPSWACTEAALVTSKTLVAAATNQAARRRDPSTEDIVQGYSP